MSQVMGSPPVNILNILTDFAFNGAAGRSIEVQSCLPIREDTENLSPSERISIATVASSLKHPRMNAASTDLPLSGTPWKTKKTFPCVSGTMQYPITSKILCSKAGSPPVMDAKN